MEKFVLKPLAISDKDQMGIFANKLKDSNRLYILGGKPKVGKSAFIFKLLNYMFTQSEKYRPILFIHFDKTIDYWKKQFDSAEPDILKNVSFKAFSTKNYLSLSSYIHSEITENNYQILIIDGVYLLEEYENRRVKSRFMIELMDLAHSMKIPIIITERYDKPKIIPISVIHAQRPKLPETWYLERPEYIMGEIREFGDSRVLVF